MTDTVETLTRTDQDCQILLGFLTQAVQAVEAVHAFTQQHSKYNPDPHKLTSDLADLKADLQRITATTTVAVRPRYWLPGGRVEFIPRVALGVRSDSRGQGRPKNALLAPRSTNDTENRATRGSRSGLSFHRCSICVL
jgi:hypothetical protein